MNSTDIRLRHLCRRLYALGERPVFELLRELAAGRDLMDALEEDSELTPELVRAVGADEMPPLPFSLVGTST
jgi:hypothetical protein